MEYDIHVMKVQDYSLKSIFEKNLLFLIPFYIFSHESRFQEYEEDAKKLATLKQEYEWAKGELEGLLAQGVVSEYTKCTIIDMSNKVVEHLAAKYQSVREGVKAVMGGKILEYEAKTIRDEGMQAGLHKGRMQILSDLVRDGVLSVTEAALKAGLTEEAFRDVRQEGRKA